MKIKGNKTSLTVTADCLKITYLDTNWQTDQNLSTYVLKDDQSKVYLKDFKKISEHSYCSGTHQGCYLDYEDDDLLIRTFYMIEKISDEVLLRLLVIKDDAHIQEIHWPSPLVTDSGYHVLPIRQGVQLFVDDMAPLAIPFNGQFCSAGAYLSMLGSVLENGNACLMINETPWDSRYEVAQLTNISKTRLGFVQMNSLGKMRYRRDLRYRFFKEVDYNDLAKAYRTFLNERGMIVKLAQKAVDLPQIQELIKASFVHMGIKTYVQPDSRFYDPLNPNKNNHLTSFALRAKEMTSYKEMGMNHLYLHLDGWGIAYDNGHPDVMPINEEAGGKEEMLNLVKKVHELGYLFGIHDQYRDYYFRAESYDPEYAIVDEKGYRYEHANWAGGRQNYLCASLAKDYVKRNFTQLKEQGIDLDGAYLDVFTCNELDQCANPNHYMTRKDCADKRGACFRYLTANGIMPSSEELNEWAMKDIVFCHYAPYEFQMHEDGKGYGRPIPLFNLVFHDCAIIPWMMDRPNDDYMLYALLNGGAPYFKRDAAYPNIDGAFTHGLVPLEEQKERCLIVSDFHQLVAGKEMLHHEFLDAKGRIQRTVFADHHEVTINLDKGTYTIK